MCVIQNGSRDNNEVLRYRVNRVQTCAIIVVYRDCVTVVQDCKSHLQK